MTIIIIIIILYVLGSADFTAPDIDLIFLTGETQRCVNISITNDIESEPDPGEEFNVSLVNPIPALDDISFVNSSTTIIIQDCKICSLNATF